MDWRAVLRRGSAAALACALLALAGGAPARAADASLAGHWPLDGPSAAGTRTPDVSGNASDALIASGTPFVPDGRLGGALDQTTDLHDVRVPAVAALEPARLTLTAWIKRMGGAPGADRYIIAKGGNPTCTSGEATLATSSYSLSTNASQDLVFRTWDGLVESPTQSPAKPGAEVFDGQWHALAGVFDGSKTRLYVDGTQVGDGASGTSSIAYGLQERALTFGGHALASCSGHFPGLIDDVRVYSRVLSDADIAALARGEEPAAPPEGTPAPVQPPVNRTRPSIAPEPGVAGTYRCDPGSWEGQAGDFRYAWRDLVRGGTIATTPTFTPKPADYGYPFLCAVTAANAGGENTATSDSAFFTSEGLNVLPPPYGNLAIRGIDVFQTVQPNSGAQMFGFPSGAFPSIPGAGTPTSYRAIGVGSLLSAVRPQEVQYNGVTLDSLKQTTAVVYLNVYRGTAADPKLPVEVTLTARRGGKPVGEPLVKQVTNPSRSDNVVVTPYERQRPEVFFRVPAAWLAGGALDLQASVNFRPGELGATYGRRECDAPCSGDNTFLLKGVRAEGPPQLIIGSIQLTTAGQGNLPAPGTVLGAARKLFPGGERAVVPGYAATLDITTEAGLTGSAVPTASTPTWTCNGFSWGAPNFTTLAQVNRACRQNAIGARITGWMATNPARELTVSGRDIKLITRYDLLLAAHNYSTGTVTEPGWQNNGDITGVSELDPLGGAPFLAVTTATRPLTAVAHELGHALSAPHADQVCGGNSNGQVGEPWAPDNRGRLEGTKFIQPSTLGRTNVKAVVEVDDPVFPRFDLMSYCSSNSDTSYRSPGDAWLSAFNWNRFFKRLRDFGRRVGYTARPSEISLGTLPGRLARAAQARAKRSRFGVAVGVVGPDGGRITHVDPPDRQRADVPGVPASPVRLRSLDGAGKVLLDAGVAVRESTELPAGSGGTFAGPVAANAATVELVRDGAVVDTLRRGAAPKVALRAPRAGTRVGAGGALAVRWSSSGSAARTAVVAFSADGGRSWRTVFDGPDRGTARVSGRVLPGTADGRVRVVVSDGLGHARAMSGRIVAAGRPPAAAIIAPEPGDEPLAGDRILLIGSAVTDRGASLRDRALRWFAGTRLLGSGEQVRARLRPGRVTLRLVARDGRGATGTASLRVTVRRRGLRITTLRFPRIVKAKATSVRGTIAVSERAQLESGGRRVGVGPKTRQVTLALPATPKHGLVRALYTLRPRGTGAGGKLRGVVEVVRP